MVKDAYVSAAKDLLGFDLMKKRQKMSDQEIWELYNHIESQKESGMQIISYCNKNNIDAKRFKNVKSLINYPKTNGPEHLKNMYSIHKERKENHLTRDEICIKYSISTSQFNQFNNYIYYKKIIDKYKEPEKESMNFVKVATTSQTPVFEKEPELIEKQNDLEIIISKGIKVTISPNICSSSIIKIIEVLKEI